MHTISVFSLIFQNESPSESDLNALGKYLLVSMIFVVAAMIEFAIVVMVNRMSSPKSNISSESKIDTISKKLFCGGRLKDQKQVGDDGKVPKENFKIETYKNIEQKESKKNWMFFKSSVNAIDITAFLMFFSFYFVFNVQYWLQYSVNFEW